MPQDFSRLSRSCAALVGVLILAGCGGGGSGGNPGGGGNPPPNPPAGGTVTVSGRVTFDRLQFQTIQGAGLNAATPVVSPAREVTVEAVNGTTVAASTTTDSNGNYSLAAPANSNVFIRVRAQMLKTGTAPTWNFAVRNNTNSDAMYVLDGDAFATGTANVTRDLHAPSGWTGTSYGNTRAAAPFAILDTVYRAKELIRTAAPNAAFPALNLYWSTQNRDNASGFCPDTGDIGTSFYFSDPTNATNDRCSPARPLPTGIYILGEYRGVNAGDTDEFDAHVIAHEFGHYFEDRFSRSDSTGGDHGIGDQLDLRVAFGEGWGNAFSAMSLGDPQYRDSGSGISSDFSFSLESDSTLKEGWFSESSVGEILWDIFDTTAEPGDNVTLGFAPIYAVMNDEQVSTNALTSIFSFASALRADNAGQSSSIRDLLQNEKITGTGEFGASENNGGDDPGFTDVYTDITVNSTVTGLCSTSTASGAEGANKLGNVRFLRFVKGASPALVTFQATGVASATVPGAAAQDPDILVYQRGTRISFGTNGDGTQIGESTATGQETISQVQLPAGTYVLQVHAFEVIDPDDTQRVNGPRCLNLTITGT